jgi:hypothetical protein
MRTNELPYVSAHTPEDSNLGAEVVDALQQQIDLNRFTGLVAATVGGFEGLRRNPSIGGFAGGAVRGLLTAAVFKGVSNFLSDNFGQDAEGQINYSSSREVGR